MGPTMTSLSLQSLQAPSGGPLSSHLPTLSSYSQQTLPKAMRGTKDCPQEGYGTISISQTFPFPLPFGHWSSPQSFTVQPIFIFPPEEAAFTPAQTLQLARVQAAGLYLHVTSKAFIWQAVWKMPVCYINLCFSLHSPFLINVWGGINMGLGHKVCIWAFLMSRGAELAPETGEESPFPHVAPESLCIAATLCHRIPSSAWIYSHCDFFPPAFPTLSPQTVIWF